MVWSKRIRPNIADQTRARIARNRICHSGNVLKVDNRLGGKKGWYFDYKDRGGGIGVGNGYLRYIKY